MQKLRLHIPLTILAAIIFVAMPTSFAYAQSTPTPGTPTTSSTDCSTDTQDCSVAAVKNYMALTGATKDSSGNALASCIANGGNNASGIITAICGDNVNTAGTLPWFSAVSYKAGDQIRCVSSGVGGVGAYDCTVTHSDGTMTGYHEPTSGTVQIRQHDAQGNILSDQSSSQSALAQTVNNAIRDTASQALNRVAQAILTFANFLLGLAGTLLNFVVVKTVFQFATLIGNSPGLLIAWGILRDIGNMFLLFGFIFMGLATILDLHTYNVKKALPQLIIFAILMNFSLFAAEAIIDSSNVITTAMYSQAGTDSTCGTTGNAGAASDSQNDCATNYGIAGHIIQATGLSTIFAVNTQQNLAAGATAFIGLALFSTIGAIVLFAAAIMLAIRAITLTFLMVFAPIGFAGMAIPPLQQYASKWWNALIHQAFFAPILFLLLLVSLKITDSFTATSADRSLAGAIVSPNASVMGIVLVFLLVIGFMVGSLMAARSFGAAGASFAIGIATKAIRSPYALAGGLGLRYSAGKGSSALQKSYNAMLGSRPGLRNALVATGIDAAVMGTLDKGKNARYGGLASYEETVKHNKEREHETEDADRKASKARDLRNARNMSAGTPAEIAARNSAIATALKDMSTKELETLDDIKHGVADLVQNLSPEQFEGLMKSDKINETEKAHIAESRYSQLLSAAAAPGATPDQVRAVTRNMSKSELERVPPALFDSSTPAGQNFLDALSDKQREDLAGSDKRTNVERQTLRQAGPVAVVENAYNTARTAALAAGANAGAATSAGVAAATAAHGGAGLGRLTPEQVTKLSNDILVNTAAVSQLTPGMLAKLQDGSKLQAGQMQTIGNNIRAAGNNASQALRDYVTNGPSAALWS